MSIDKSPSVPFEFETRSEPLTGRLDFVDGAESILPAGFLDKLTDCLTFNEPQLTPVNARGRSYFVEIPTTIGPYDALQVSGGGHIDNGLRTMRFSDRPVMPGKVSKIIEPPRKDFDTFEAAGTSYLDESGNFRVDYSIGIFGTYVGRKAEAKVQKTLGVWNDLNGQTDELIVPRVIGSFVYDLPDGEGSSQTAVLMLVPNGGLRFGDFLAESDRQLLVQFFDDQDIVPLIQRQYREELPEIIQALGYGIAKIHDLGYSHNQTHAGNLATVLDKDGRQIPFIADWDTSRKPREDLMLLAQTGDFLQAITSQIMRITNIFGLTGLYPGAQWGPIKSTANNMLRGYAAYYNHPNPLDLKFDARKMLEHVSGVHGDKERIGFFYNVLAEVRGKN